MSMVGHDDLQSHHLLVSWFTYKQNKTKQSPFICGDPTPTPSYQPSHLLLFINLSPVSSNKFETLGGKKHPHPHPSIRTRRMMSWCKLSKASSQKWPFPRLEIDFAASVVLIPQKNNGEKAIPIWGIQAIHFFWKSNKGDLWASRIMIMNVQVGCTNAITYKQLDRIKVLTFSTTFKRKILKGLEIMVSQLYVGCIVLELHNTSTLAVICWFQILYFSPVNIRMEN